MFFLQFSAIFIAILATGHGQMWQQWQVWTSCKAECGVGTQVRFRRCQKIRPNARCIGWFSEERHCQASRSCGQAYPVCSEWGQWGECSKSCGVAIRAKYRLCTLKSGASERKGEYELCRQSPCEMPQAVWMEWMAWSACTNRCGQGRQLRVRVCRKLVSGTTDTCKGISTERRMCSETKGCFSEKWSIWGTWSRCIGNCGRTGWRYRTRFCENVGRREENCPGVPEGYRRCARKCPSAEKLIWSSWKTEEPPEWKQWTAWSECSVTCGGGISVRSRMCKDGLKPGCDGHNRDFKDCGSAECKIVSSWNGWSKWSECTETCGRGARKRARTCAGEACEGQNDSTQECNLGECSTGCAGPERLENGYILGIKDAYKADDVIAFLCNDRFILVGDAGIVCLPTGEWSHEAPSCVENPVGQCSVPPAPSHGSVNMDKGGSAEAGSKADFECEPKYVLLGESTITCMKSGQWSDDPPVCAGPNFCGLVGDIDNSLQSAPVGGRTFVAADGAWPWQGLIVENKHYNVKNSLEAIVGGASVLSEKWILTAAHVFAGLDNNFLSNSWSQTILVILGVSKIPQDISENTEAYEPNVVVRHPDFDERSFDYDLALIGVGRTFKVEKGTFMSASGKGRVTFSPDIRPVCLPCINDSGHVTKDFKMKLTNEVCPENGNNTRRPKDDDPTRFVVTGYGRTETTRSDAVLQQVAVELGDNDQCARAAKNMQDGKRSANFTSRMVCTVPDGREGSKINACQGASGGPLVQRVKTQRGSTQWVQIGVVSWGLGCFRTNGTGLESPGFYTKLSEVMKFIVRTMAGKHFTT